MIIEFYFCTACNTTVLRRDIEWKIESEDIRGPREELTDHPELDVLAIKCPNCERTFAMIFKKKGKKRKTPKAGQKTLDIEIKKKKSKTKS